MSALFSRPTATVIVEFTETTAHIANEARSSELAIERDAGGHLAPGAVETIRGALQSFASKPGEPIFCLLPARGVSLRRISLPAASKADIDRLLPLQIDAQFPIASEELAWGYSELAGAVPSSSGGAMREIVVAAVKKDAVEQYRQVLTSAGFAPLFSVAALVRSNLAAHRPARFGVVEIGGSKSELLTFDESGPAALRVISLGAETSPSAQPLLEALRNNGAVEKIYVSGKSAASWTGRISEGIPAEPLAVPPGQSAAMAGLREALRRGEEPLLIHATREPVSVQRAPAQWRWAAAAAVLLVALLALRFAEPIIRRGQLTRAMAEMKAARAKLPNVDREVGFLNYIKTNQPVYLEVVADLAAAAPPGTKLDSLTISRRGEISLRGTAQNAQQAGALRAKMFDSGAFLAVVIDEQTPVQNQQQVNFRMTAHLRPAGTRPAKPAGESKPGRDPKPPTPGGRAAPPVVSEGPPPGMEPPPMLEGGPPVMIIPPQS